jgi:hypothetical protein
MAVINDYVDANILAGKKANPANIMPGQIFGIAGTFEVAAADDNGSIYRIARLSSNMIPYELCVMGDDALDITHVDVGLYLPGAGGAVVDLDCFADNLATNGDAIDSADLACNALFSLPIDDIGKKLWEIAAVKAAGTYTDAKHPSEFDLAITAKSEPGAAATVSFRGLFLQG